MGAELGRVALYQLRAKPVRMHTLRFNVDVFPGYHSQLIGPNPYSMFRETFNVKHLASIIPDTHDLTVPELAEPVDFQEKKKSAAIEEEEGQSAVQENVM